MPFEPHICDCSIAAYRHVVKSKAEWDRHHAMKQNDILDMTPLDSQILQMPALQRRDIYNVNIAAGEVGDHAVRVNHERTSLLDMKPIVPMYNTVLPTRRQKKDLRDGPGETTYTDNFPDHRQEKDFHCTLRPTLSDSRISAIQPKKSILDYQNPIPTYETSTHSRKRKKDIGDVPNLTPTIGMSFSCCMCKSG
jgi:hypothetical protein